MKSLNRTYFAARVGSLELSRAIKDLRKVLLYETRLLIEFSSAREQSSLRTTLYRKTAPLARTFARRAGDAYFYGNSEVSATRSLKAATASS